MARTDTDERMLEFLEQYLSLSFNNDFKNYVKLVPDLKDHAVAEILSRQP